MCDGAAAVIIPRYEADLFTDDVIDDPWPHLRALRDAGPLVWLEAHGMYAATRYAEVRSILGGHATFVSGEGVALNDVINNLGHLAFGHGEHACVGTGRRDRSRRISGPQAQQPHPVARIAASDRDSKGARVSNE